MAVGTTLLSYEMSWQLKLFELMTNCQQMGDYVMACQYGIGFYKILGMKDFPKKRVSEKSGPQPELDTWKEYFIEIMLGGVSQVGQDIERVRAKYAKKDGIPEYQKRYSNSIKLTKSKSRTKPKS